jgi:DNA recombination protein RmuC
MSLTTQNLIFIAIAFFLGIAVHVFIARSKIKLIVENEKAQLNTQLKLSQQSLSKLKELFIKSHQNNKKTEKIMGQLRENNKQLSINLSIAQQQLLNEKEKITLLNETKEELKNQFKLLANDIFDDKDKKHAQLNKEKLEALLNPFSKQLDDFKHKIDTVYHDEGKQRASLITEVKNLRDLNQQLNQEAINLTRALKGDKKMQGNWGELILEKVLEQSGLRKGQEYDTQGGFRDEDNNLLKPDVIIHLPQGKEVIVDSKVSLIAYEKYTSASEKFEQVTALNEHVNAINKHIVTLSEKDYSALQGINSLDFVILFIPIESAFIAAFNHNEKLFSEAFSRKIIVVTPTTLLATLKTIENLWRYEKQNQNAQEIANKAGVIYDKFRGFIEDIEKLGKQLDTTHTTYHDALNKLTRGRGNLVNHAQQLLELGVKVKKEIPKTVLEKSDTQPGNE